MTRKALMTATLVSGIGLALAACGSTIEQKAATGAVAGAVVGRITVADVDDGSRHDFTVSDARFEVASGQLRLKPGVMLRLLKR